MISYTWLTPPAPAAIAVVHVPALSALLDRPVPEPGQARFARLVEVSGAVVDELIADRIDADTLWLTPHGGPGVRAAVDRCLTRHGLRETAVALPDRWMVLAQAAHPAAVAWLVQHPEPPYPPLLFRQPLVLITGPANAGKSALLNAWCGHDRALVSAQPGTTRDLVTASALVHGWRLRLMDSAGLRPTDDLLEQAGQDLVAQARERADLVLYLRPPGDLSPPHPGDLQVDGKADLCPAGAALPWSCLGYDGRSSAELLAGVGEAVLARLGLG